MPLTLLLSVLHLSLTPSVIAFLTSENLLQKNPPNLKKELQSKSDVCFSLPRCVCLLVLRLEAHRLSSFGYVQLLFHFPVGSIVLTWVEYCEIF